MKCPHCGVKGSLDDSFLHRKIRCPRCQQVFRADPDETENGDSETKTPAGEVVPALAEVAGDEAGYYRPENHLGEFAAQVEERLDDILTSVVPPPPDGMAATDGLGEGGDSVPKAPPPPPPLSPSHGEGGGPAEKSVWQAAEVPVQQDDSLRESFTVGGALQEAWQLTKGAKGQIWMAILVASLVMLGLGGVVALPALVTGSEATTAAGGWLSAILNIISNILSTILSAGLMYMGVRRATNRSLSWQQLFSGFQMALSICIASILQMILIGIGCLLLLLPGIYLMVGYCLTLPLIIDRRMPPWQAMETSRKAVHKVWWKVFGLFAVSMLIAMVSAVPLLIGLIWTVPMYFVLGGVVYRSLLGIENGRPELASGGRC